MKKADRLLTSIQQGYGDGSDTHQDLQKMAAEATETLRSIRELTRKKKGKTFFKSPLAQICSSRVGRLKADGKLTRSNASPNRSCRGRR